VLDLILRRHFKKEKIRSILDVGVGWGKYGLMLREYLYQTDIMKPRKSWKLRLDTVEIYPSYIKSHIRNLYDSIHIADIRDFSKTPEKWCNILYWDVVLMADIIEHMSKEEGYAVIDNLLKYCKEIVVSTPTVMEKQPVHLFHENEEHLSVWEKSDFISKYTITGIHTNTDFITVGLQGKQTKEEGVFLFL
jgi:cyclopropane fatty-acyl-phospholipid synthase-like methyltransferase